MRCPYDVGDDVPAFVSHCNIHWLPNFRGFLSAALITRRASSNFTAVIASPLSSIRSFRYLTFLNRNQWLLAFAAACTIRSATAFRVRKHWNVTGGTLIDVAFIAIASAFCSSGGNSAIIIGNHAPRWLGFPCGSRDCRPKNKLTLWGPVSPSRAASRCLADPGEVFSDSFGVTVRKPSESAGLRCLAEPEETVW